MPAHRKPFRKHAAWRQGYNQGYRAGLEKRHRYEVEVAALRLRLADYQRRYLEGDPPVSSKIGR